MSSTWVGIAALVFAASLTLLNTLPVEYAPREDRGINVVMIRAPAGSSLEYTFDYVTQVEDILIPYTETGDVRRVLTRSGSWRAGSDVNTARMFTPLSLWGERDVTGAELVQEWNAKLGKLPGVTAYAFPAGSPITGFNSRPFQVVLGGTDYDQLAQWRDIVMEEAGKIPGLSNLQSDYQERKPKLDVAIDRDRAADLGVSLSNVGRTLETFLGSRVVTTFIDRGEEYRVILQGADTQRQSPSDLHTIYVRSESSGQLIPLSNLIKIRESAGPVDLRRFDRMRSITISGNLGPGFSLGAVLDSVDEIIRTKLPETAQINYDGESRELRSTGGSLYFTFVLALLVAYLVLAAQFESFRHPLIIMTTVPLAIAGAVIGLSVFDSSINIFSQIGAIMLIGLADLTENIN